MTVLVIDGQGGNLGKQLVQKLLARIDDIDLIAVGTNSLATESMLKAGAKKAATGENAIAVCSAKADVIVGPLGIVLADALLGEVTQKAAVAVSRSSALRVLIPVAKCETVVAGINNTSVSELIDDAVLKIEAYIKSPGQC